MHGWFPRMDHNSDSRPCILPSHTRPAPSQREEASKCLAELWRLYSRQAIRHLLADDTKRPAADSRMRAGISGVTHPSRRTPNLGHLHPASHANLKEHQPQLSNKGCIGSTSTGEALQRTIGGLGVLEYMILQHED